MVAEKNKIMNGSDVSLSYQMQRSVGIIVMEVLMNLVILIAKSMHSTGICDVQAEYFLSAVFVSLKYVIVLKIHWLGYISTGEKKPRFVL